jgi:hypothetical protein
MPNDETFENVQRAICAKKRPFSCKRTAKIAVKAMKKHGRNFTAYDCPWCEKWHMTNKRKKNENENENDFENA